MTFDRGSSPLARGLRDRRGERRRGRRIIPARAGFTSPDSSPTRQSRDHPRSRGVYRKRCGRRSSGRGSSPLARGLRRRHAHRRQHPRIIPARAGFTSSPPPSSIRRPDHPRSRGVYRPLPARRHRRSGSSPLARGLRPVVAPIGGQPLDHPRSRGVYTCPLAFRESRSGSSPLARGLRARLHLDSHRPRIIPARAGFTPSGARSATACRDHPRSRGVYATTTPPTCPSCGSSPLARGLPGVRARRAAGRGIIPARAGFTRRG